MPISFKVTTEEAQLIGQIADRAHRYTPSIDRLSLEMDLTAVHANDIRLRLFELLQADKAVFAHDVYGIMRHIDRSTGCLDGRFLPRYSEAD